MDASFIQHNMDDSAAKRILIENLMCHFSEGPAGWMNHFTGKSGLIGIVSSGKLRLSLYSDMCNDSTEGVYVQKLYQDVLGECYYKKEISSEFFEAVRNPPLSFYRVFTDTSGESKVIRCKPYVVCFSQNDDDEVMGERYYREPEGGWFTVDSKIYVFSNCGCLPNSHIDTSNLMEIYRVCYDEDVVKSRIYKMIMDFQGIDPNYYGLVSKYIGIVLSSIRIFVKNPIEGFSGGSVVENPPANVEAWVQSLVQKIPDFLWQLSPCTATTEPAL